MKLYFCTGFHRQMRARKKLAQEPDSRGNSNGTRRKRGDYGDLLFERNLWADFHSVWSLSYRCRALSFLSDQSCSYFSFHSNLTPPPPPKKPVDVKKTPLPRHPKTILVSFFQAVQATPGAASRVRESQNKRLLLFTKLFCSN